MRKHKKAGFTLIEIMLTIIILLVLAIGAASALTRTGISVAKQGHSRVIMELINNRLEELEERDFDSIVDHEGPMTMDDISYNLKTVVTEQLIETDGEQPAKRKIVQVEISYNEETVSGETIIVSKFGILN